MRRYYELITGLSWTILIMAVYALGQTIPLPGIDLTEAADTLQKITFLQLFASTTGSNLSLPTLFSVGLGPYMSGMVIWQAIQVLAEERISRLSLQAVSFWRYLLTLLLAAAQSFQIVYLIRSSLQPLYWPGTNYNLVFPVTMIMLVSGAMFVTWLGNMNAARGVGNTVALIIPGIVMRLPASLSQGFGALGGVSLQLTTQVVTTALVISTIFIVVMSRVNNAELRIPLERPLLQGNHPDAYIPIRLIASGGMPFMFSGSLFMLPRYFVNQTVGPTNAWQRFLATWFSFRTPQGVLMYAFVMIVLAYAFGYLNIMPTKMAKDLKESGDYIIGIDPGDATERYIVQHLNRLNVVGNLIIVLIGAGPLAIGLFYPPAINYSAFLGSLMILVGICGNVGDQVRSLWNKNRYQIFD